MRRIGTLNCAHAAFPIIVGVSIPQYTAQELEQLRADNEEGITYNGKHYTRYEAKERQRRLEASIRKQRRRILIDEATGDQQKLQADQIKGQVLRQEYTRFSKAAGLRQQHDRMETVGYSWKQERAVEKAFLQSQQKAVENVEKPVIMDTRNGEGGADVHYITKIDVEKYRCITEDITTDEVIITDERIQHIQERHPNDYERYAGYLKDIVEKPQYILEDKSPNTAVILNEYIENGERFRLVMRLAVPKDPPTYKNSVITFMEIGERKFKKYLRNKKILYKSE